MSELAKPRTEAGTQTRPSFPSGHSPSRLRPPKKVTLNVGTQVDLGKENFRRYVKESVSVQTLRRKGSDSSVQVDLTKKYVSDAGMQVEFPNENETKLLDELEMQKKVNLAIAELCVYLSRKESEGEDNEGKGKWKGCGKKSPSIM